jgi:hypothetical protein
VAAVPPLPPAVPPLPQAPAAGNMSDTLLEDEPNEFDMMEDDDMSPPLQVITGRSSAEVAKKIFNRTECDMQFIKMVYADCNKRQSM